MLWLIALLQIIVYLLLMPLIRIGLNYQDLSFNYSFWIVLFFCIAFFIAKVSVKYTLKKRQTASVTYELSSPGIFIFVIWAGCHIAFSWYLGLYNRRTGTEEISVFFAQMPVLLLVMMRGLEISLPYIASVVLSDILGKKFFTAKNTIAVAMLGLVFLFSGALNSRSQTALLLLILLVNIQNIVPRQTLYRLAKYFLFIGVLAIILITIFRVMTLPDGVIDGYLDHEVLQRLDGLEVLSQVDANYDDVSWLGIRYDVLLNPLIASVPFLDAAIELKSSAMTTVKSLILRDEFASGLKDINSFVILDAYYGAGIVGVFLIGFLISFLACLVDKKISLVGSRSFQVFLVAVSINLISLEAESTTILVEIIRDWLFLLGVSYILVQKNKRRSVSTKVT